MIFYFVIEPGPERMHCVATQAEAKAINKDFVQIDVPIDKLGLRDWIQKMIDELSTPKPPIPTMVEVAPPLGPPELIITESYAEQTLKIDDLWDQLPLARKFHFASLAMEEGRDILGGMKLP